MHRLVFGILLVAASCQQATEKQDSGKVRLFGQIEGDSPSGQTIQLFDALDREMTSDIAEDGRFSLEMPLSSPGYFLLRVDSKPIQLYLSENYNLTLRLEAGSPEVQITGRGSENNQYIRAFERFEAANKPAYDRLLVRHEEDFLLEARRYRSKCEAFLSNYQAKNVNLDPKFISKERARILYAWANRLVQYPEAHLFYTGEDEFAVSANYHDYKKTVNLDAIDLLTLPEYQNFVTSYIDYEAEILKKKGDKRDLDQIRFDLVTQDINETGVRDFAMFSILRRAMQHGLSGVTKDLLSIFYDQCQNSLMLAEIRGEEHGWLRIAPGKTAPAIKGVTLSGERVNLSQFEGKFIYLNFWASWCTPCTSEYATFAHVAEVIDSNSIVLMSISLDTDRDIWQRHSRERTKPVIDLFLTKDVVNEVREEYQIRSLPRYILVDPSGKIIDSNAPGPSDAALLSLLASFELAALD
ncbi:MAG: AhpC/TSA family protein [Saprospiraceae bacterium]|nr:AhpC/TSA family protein [Saprospiraceae bacterium]